MISLVIVRLKKEEVKKTIINAKEVLDEVEELSLKAKNDGEKICFFPVKKAFINKTKKERKNILLISLLFLVLFLISIPLGINKYIYDGIENTMAIVGMISFACSISGFCYYASRQNNIGENLIRGNLYFDISKNIIFFDTNKYYYGHLPEYNKHFLYFFEIKGNTFYKIERESRFGLPDIEQVIYSIKNISHISVAKDNITLFGDIIMTSFDQSIRDDTYLNYIILNEKVTFLSENKNVQMFSKEIESIKIPRIYSDFEKFLILKQYVGSEKL